MGVDARMFISTKNRLTKKEVLNLACDLAEAFGPDRFLIRKEDKEWGPKRQCLTIVKHIEQDGPRIYPKKGEQFIEVNLFTRYYGVGYERGDLPLILMVARWLQDRVPNCTIHYGGDSSGVLITPLTTQRANNLWQHFAQVGHGPYLNYKMLTSGLTNIPQCDLCERSMTQTGWGSSWDAVTCYSCDTQLETRDKGKTYTKKLTT